MHDSASHSWLMLTKEVLGFEVTVFPVAQDLLEATHQN